MAKLLGVDAADGGERVAAEAFDNLGQVLARVRPAHADGPRLPIALALVDLAEDRRPVAVLEPLQPLGDRRLPRDRKRVGRQIERRVLVGRLECALDRHEEDVEEEEGEDGRQDAVLRVEALETVHADVVVERELLDAALGAVVGPPDALLARLALAQLLARDDPLGRRAQADVGKVVPELGRRLERVLEPLDPALQRLVVD